MRAISIIKLLLLLFCFCLSIYSQSETAPEEIYRNTEGAIVYISTFDIDSTLLGFGSGVVVSDDGKVYTNYHVIRNSSRIEIRNERTIITNVKIISINPSTDAAILKIPPGTFTSVNIADSFDAIIGQKIFALGNPRGLEKTFSGGIVSSIRDLYGKLNIQYTASISPGSSGGALLNEKGELIGVTCSSFPSGQNLNFAVPVKEFTKIEMIDPNDTSQVSMMNSVCRMFGRADDETDMVRDTLFAEICRFENSSEYYYEFLGNLFNEFGESDSAIEYYSKGISLYPGSKTLYKLRAESRTGKDIVKEGLQDYQKAIEIDSNYTDCYISRASYYRSTPDSKAKAIEDYTRAIELKPTYYYLYMDRAAVYLDMKDTLNAVKDLNNTIVMDEEDFFTLERMARMYESIGYYDDAIYEYTLALKFNEDPQYYLNRAILHSKNENHLLAVKDYLDYLSYEPYDVTAYNNLAYCYLGDGDYDMAKKYFNKSLQYDYRHFDSYIGLSIMNYRLGELRKSIKNMVKAIEIESVLSKGIPGLGYLESNGYFWDMKEIKDIKQVFKIMGLETKNKILQNYPKAKIIRAESSE